MILTHSDKYNVLQLILVLLVFILTKLASKLNQCTVNVYTFTYTEYVKYDTIYTPKGNYLQL